MTYDTTYDAMHDTMHDTTYQATTRRGSDAVEHLACRSGRLARSGLAVAAGLVLTLAAALPAAAQASRTRPETGRSGGTATRSSPPPSSSASSAPRGSASGSSPAARTRPAEPGSGGRAVISEDGRGPRGSRRVFVGGYPFGFGWGGYYPSVWRFGYGGWYGGWYGGPGYGPGGYGARWYGERVREDMGALDLDLKPGDTRIYLDGQYIGTADRFDGWPQYLWLEEGSYQLVFHREGHETIAREYRIHPGLVIDVEDRLARGEATPPEQLFAPRPTPRRDARVRRNEERRRAAEAGDWRERVERSRAERGGAERGGRESGGTERGGTERGEAAPGEGDEPAEYAAPEAGAAFGSLRLSVRPADASVYLDGRFIGTGEELARLRGGLTVEAGEHVVAAVRPGHAPEEVAIDVEAGEVLELEVVLDETPGGV